MLVLYTWKCFINELFRPPMILRIFFFLNWGVVRDLYLASLCSQKITDHRQCIWGIHKITGYGFVCSEPLIAVYVNKKMEESAHIYLVTFAYGELACGRVKVGPIFWGGS